MNPNPASSHPLRWAALVAALLAVLWSALSLFRFHHFSSAEDLAMFDQMLWNFRQGRGLVTSLSGNMNLLFPHHFFGEHFSPILLLVAPIAGLTPGPEAILVLQAVALALSLIPAFLLAKDVFGTSESGLAAGVLWLLLPAFWIAVLYDFHPEAFEPLFLLAFWLAFRKGLRSSWLWALLYLSCKEDAALYLCAVAFFGGIALNRKPLGFSLAAVSFGYAVLTALVAIPHFSPTGVPLMASRPLLPAQAGGLAPWAQEVFFDVVHWRYLGIHLLSFALLPLAAGWLILPAAGSVALMWVSKSEYQQAILLHYVFTVYPLLAIAAIEGARRFQNVGIATPTVRRRAVLLAWALCVVASGILFFEVRDYSEPFGNLRFESTSAARAELAGIPSDASVAADWSLAAHVARREQLALLIEPFNSDFVAARLDGLNHPVARFVPETLLATNSTCGLWREPVDPVAVFKKDSPPIPSAARIRDEQFHLFNAETANHESGRSVIDLGAQDKHAWHGGTSDRNGALLYGPNLDLPAGTYCVTFRVRTRVNKRDLVGLLDVSEGPSAKTLAQHELRGSLPSYEKIPLRVELAGLGNVEFRCFKVGKGDIWIDRVTWESISTGGK